VVTELYIAKIFRVAQAQAVTMKIASYAFTKIGICPADPKAFGDEDFVAYEPTERSIRSPLPQLGTSLSDHPIAEHTDSLTFIWSNDVHKNGRQKHKVHP